MRVFRMVLGLAIGALAPMWLVIAQISAPLQALSPGEVRLSSRPYQPRPILRAESRLVQLEVVVRDRRGLAVPGLTKDDFDILDAGKKRELTAFTVATFTSATTGAPKSVSAPEDSAAQSTTPQPATSAQVQANGRWIALLFDDINTAPGDLAHAKIAALRFIKEAVRSGDRIAVLTTSDGGSAPFTDDSIAILARMKNVQSHPRMSASGLSQCPRMTAYEAYQILNHDPMAMQAKVLEACHCSGAPVCGIGDKDPTSLFDPTSRLHDPETVNTVLAQAQQTWDQARLVSQATLDAIKSSMDQLARTPGTRMLLLASSGFLSGMLDEQQDAIINEALHAGVVINALDAKGLYAEAPGRSISETVEVDELPLSSAVFEIRSLGDRLDSLDSPLAQLAESTGGQLFRNNNDLDLGFYQLGLLPACTYLLGFAPAEDGKYHKIKVELRNATHDILQVRPGYFAPTTAPSPQPSAGDKLDALMRGSVEQTDLPSTITENLGTSTSGSPQLTVQAHIDIQKLPFEQQKDRHVQKLTFVAALFDPQNNFVTGKQADMELALKPESFDRLSRTGINGVMQIEVPPGNYRLRIVVQEAMHGAISATSRELQVAPPMLAAPPSRDIEKKLKNRGLQWSPPALDSPIHSLESSTLCDIANVLEQAGARESEQATNLQNFTAQEKIEYQTSSRRGILSLGSETFDYIIVLQRSPQGLVFQEKRNPRHGSSLSPAANQDMGLPEMALIFLPNMRDDYEMSCEGAVEWSGQLTWVVRFQQRKDKPSRTFSFRGDNAVYPAKLKGRAWIASDSGVVVHMETELMEGVPAVKVRNSYLSIDYSPVQFQSQPLRIWLPKMVDGYWDFGDHRIIVYHTFTDFLLFSVQTDQKIEKPKVP